MKIDDNGVIRDMTPAEIAQAPEIVIEPSPEERIAELEEALELLLSGVTE